MLMQVTGTCDICGGTNLPFTTQEAQVTCQKCGKKYKVCLKCKTKGCPNCGGKLESEIDCVAKYGVMF